MTWPRWHRPHPSFPPWQLPGGGPLPADWAPCCITHSSHLPHHRQSWLTLPPELFKLYPGQIKSPTFHLAFGDLRVHTQSILLTTWVTNFQMGSLPGHPAFVCPESHLLATQTTSQHLPALCGPSLAESSRYLSEGPPAPSICGSLTWQSPLGTCLLSPGLWALPGWKPCPIWGPKLSTNQTLNNQAL